MSTTLGTLTLELSAPTAQLQADLRRADEMIRASNAVWSKPPTWGIAASLGDEMRAARSILNSSLKGIESDLKGYDLKFDIAKELGLEMVVAEATLDRSLKEMQSRVKSRQLDFGDFDISGIEAKIARLNGLAIAPKVDDSALTALNQHLTLKEQHLDRVVAKFGNTPIVPMVDDRQLTALNGLFDRTYRGSQINVGFNAGDIERQIDKLGKKLDRLKPPSGLFKTLTFAPTSIATGFFEGIGKNLSNGLGKGYSQGIEAALGDTIGSTELLGRKLAESIADRSKSAISQLVPAAITDAIKESIEQALGETDIFIESRSRQGKQSNQQRKTKELAREGIAEERREATRNYNIQSDREMVDRVAVTKLDRFYQAQSKVKELIDQKIESRKPSDGDKGELDGISEGLDSEIQLVIEKLGDLETAIEYVSKAAFEQAEVNLKRAEPNTPEFKKAAKEYQKTGGTLFRQQAEVASLEQERQVKVLAKDIIDRKIQTRRPNDANMGELEGFAVETESTQRMLADEQAELAKQHRSSRTAKEEAEKRLKRADRVYENLKPTQLPKVYQDALPDVPEHLIPQLVVDKNLEKQGANGIYNAKANQVRVTPDLYKAINDGILTSEQFQVMYHELTHGRDFQFGQFQGLVDRDNLEVRNPIDATAAEIKDVAPFIAQYKPELHAVEQNAEIAGRRKGGAAFERQQRILYSTQLTNTYGLGGIKLDASIADKTKNLASRAVKLGQFAKENHVDAPGAAEIIDDAIAIKSRQKQIGLDIAKASSGKLSVAEIQAIHDRVEQQILGIQDISQRIESLKENIIKRISETKQKVTQKTEPIDKPEYRVPDPWTEYTPQKLQIGEPHFVEISAPTPEQSMSANSSNKPTSKTQSGLSDREKIKQPSEKLELKAPSELTEADAITRAKSIAKKFNLASKEIKQAIKKGETDLALEMGRQIEHYAQTAQAEIASITSILGDRAAFGTPLGSQLANAKGQITRARNSSDRAVKVYRTDNKIADDDLASLKMPDVSDIAKKAAKKLKNIFATKQPIDDGEIELQALLLKKQELQAKLKSAKQPQEYFKQVKASLPPIGASDEEHAIYDRTRVEASHASYQAKLEARYDGRKLRQINRQIRRLNKSAAAKDEPISLEPVTIETAPPPPKSPAPPKPPKPPTPPTPPTPLGKLNPDELIASIQARLDVFDRVFPDADKQVRGSERRGRKNVRRFRRDIDNHQDLFDASFNRLDRESAQTLKQETAKTQNLNDRVFTDDGILSGTEKTRFALDRLIGAGKMGLAVFGGYTLLSMGVPAIIAVGKSVTDLTSNFEQLQLKLQASNGSLELGRQRFAAVRAEAQKLGVSQSGALETAARTAATTYGTELEGLPSNNFSSQITRIAQARGLSQPQTNALSLAISQILGKPRVSAEELNQLVESGGMPDARTIAARAMGMTPQQFSKVQESEAGIDPKKFMSAFLSQATSDSLLIKDDALTTQQAKLGKLQGNIENLQLTIGQGIDPVFKAGIDLLSSSIALLKDGIEFGSKVLIGFATVSLVRSIPPLINLAEGFITGGKAASYFGMSVNTMIGVAPKLGTLAVQMLAFYAIAEGIGNIIKNWKNAGDEFAAGADKIQGAIDSIKGNVDVKLTLPDRPEDIGGGDWLDGWKLAAQRTVAPIFNLNPLGKERGAVAVDREVAKASERTEGLDKSLGKVDLLFPIAKKTIGSASKLNQLDLELNQINSQRSALFITNPNDVIGIRKIDEKYRAKYQERTKLADGISPVQSAITEGLNQLNNQKSIYDKLATTKDINGRPMVSALEYGENMGRITQKTEQLKKVQEEVNKAIKSSLDNLAPWVMSLDKIVNKFEDINIQSGIMSDRLKIVRNLARDSGQVTKGQSEYQASQDNEAQLRSKIAQISATIKELKSSLNIIDPQALDNFRKNYRVTDKTSAADLTLLGNNINNPVDKQIANKLAIIKQQETNLSGLNAQISDARSEVIQRVKDENKEIRQYYLGLQREINPGQSFYNSQIAAVTIGRNKFLEAITGFGASLGDGFFGAISDLLDASRIKLEAEAAHAAEIRSIIQNADDQRTDLKSRQNNSFTPVESQKVGGFVSPLAGSDLAGIIAYQPIEQGINAQKFTSPRSGRRQHGKVDLDYRVGGGAGSGVVAATSGTATYQDWGADGGYAVFIDYKDANGRNVRINNGHLNPQSVRGVFGDKKSMPVVAGQSIGSVHKLQGRYAGVRDHLDFGVKVDGEWVDPQEYLKTASPKPSPKPAELNPSAIGMIKQYEGFHQKAYRDTDGVPTIGYGTRILPFRNRPVKMGDTIDQPEANAALDIELQQAKNIIAKNIRVPLNSNQLSALTSFVFNGGESMLKGEMADTINRGDFAGAGKLFGKYNRAMVGGKLQPLAGLTKRREAEAAMFGDSRDVPRPIMPSAQPEIQSRELLQQAKVLIDRNERDKIQASDTRYAATVSSNELAEQLKREKVIDEARKAERAARDSARNQRQSVGNLYTPDTIQGTQLKEQSDLSNRIETTLDSLLDAQIQLQRTVFKNEMVVSALSRKPSLDPNEQLSLKEAKSTLPGFKAKLAQIDKLIPLFEVAAKESKETIDRKQARENAKTITELSGSELDLKIQAYQTKKDATTATVQREPFNRDAASQDRDLELRIGLAQATKEKNSQLLTLDEKLANGTFALKYGTNKQAAYQEQVDRVNRTFDRKLNNYLNAQEQREQKFNTDLRQENTQLGYKRQEQSIGSIDTQIQRQELGDRGSAPYSNDNLIYLKSKRSSQQEQLASQRKLDDYGKQWKLAQGNPALQAQIHELANLERQDTIARRKAISENTDFELRTQGLNLTRSQFDRTQESDRSKIDIEREKLTGLKATGGYTRDREYKLEARTIQSDTNQKVFGLTQQRDAIIGTDDASIKLRNDLDALIKSTQELGDIKLANLKNQFDPIIDALTATKSATREVFETFAKTGKFDWRSILRAPTQSILTKSLDLATSGLFNAIAPASKPNNQPQDTWGQITSFLGQALFPKHADGGIIGTGRNQADDQLILAQRGEGIITHRGMDILGERGLHLLNRGLAPLPKFATGGVVGSLNNISMNLDQNKVASVGNNTVNMNFEGQSMSEEATDKHLIENLRNVVTQELIRHKKARFFN